jgi:malate dehydrogenase
MISIVGAGRVGSVCAFNLLRMNLSDIILIDIMKGLAKGEALDMLQSTSLTGFDGVIEGSEDISHIESSELVIVMAGAARKPGTSRLDLTRTNAKIVSSLIPKIVEYAPDCKIMMVTNPVDVMTYIAYKKSGFERNRVFGMGGLLDTSRYCSYLAVELGVSRNSVQGLVIGEHGDGMIPLIDYTTVSGIPVIELLNKEQIKRIIEKTKTGGMDVINLKGSTVYAPAIAIATMANSIIKDQKRIVCAPTIPEGEYGLKEISLGLPIILGNNGMEKIIELDLDETEKKNLFDAAVTIRSAISKLTDI